MVATNRKQFANMNNLVQVKTIVILVRVRYVYTFIVRDTSLVASCLLMEMERKHNEKIVLCFWFLS